MITLTRSFEKTIELTAKEQYANIQSVIYQKLKKNFENKCLQNSYITKIIEDSIFYTHVMISHFSLEGHANVNVKFKAYVDIYRRGDCIAPCKVLNDITRDVDIMCKYKNQADIMLSRNKEHNSALTASLKKDQYIPVTILEINYIAQNPTMTISGKPYSYTELEVYQVVNWDLKPEQDEIIIDLLKKLSELVKKIKTLTPETKKLDESVYPYDNTYNPKSFSKSTIVKSLLKSKASEIISDIKSTKLDYISRPNIILKSTQDYIIIPASEVNLTTVITNEIGLVLIDYIQDCINHLNMLVGMDEISKEDKSP